MVSYYVLVIEACECSKFGKKLFSLALGRILGKCISFHDDFFDGVFAFVEMIERLIYLAKAALSKQADLLILHVTLAKHLDENARRQKFEDKSWSET